MLDKIKKILKREFGLSTREVNSTFVFIFILIGLAIYRKTFPYYFKYRMSQIKIDIYHGL